MCSSANNNNGPWLLTTPAAGWHLHMLYHDWYEVLIDIVLIIVGFDSG